MSTITLPPSRPRRPTLRLITLVVLAVVVLLPAIWLLLSSLKQETEYLAYPISVLPATPQWENYRAVFTYAPFLRYAGNSLLLASVFSTLTVLTSAMAGFAFARLPSPGRARLFALVIGLLMIPGIITVIPQFIIFARLRLTNTYWPWVIWGLAASPFHIFLFRQFFSGFPRDLEDAAEVDGCGLLRMFWQIFLPNARAVIATSFIFNFVGVWGDALTPLMYLNDANTTLAVKLATAYVNPSGQHLVTVTLAACVLYTIPMVAVFFFGQRFIMQGIVTSGLKG